jgi:dUTP pyrophosphatase
MSEQVIEAIASTIRILDEGSVSAEAEVPAELVSEVRSSVKIQPEIRGNKLFWYGADALYTIEDIWQEIQKKQSISVTFAQEYGRAWSKLRQEYSTLQVQKLIPEAVTPAKAHPLDSGFDLTIVRVVNPNFGPGVILYGTGLVVRPPDGCYVDLVTRSSTSKLGWGLANSVGIIDAQYRGELCLPLFKLSPDAKDLELPARIAQLIVRPLILTDIKEMASVNETQRGVGGFGSSGK